MEAIMEPTPRNTISTNSLERRDARENVVRRPDYAQRALFSLAFLTCVTAAIHVHEIYPGLLNKEGSWCCKESDCRLALPPSTSTAKPEAPGPSVSALFTSASGPEADMSFVRRDVGY